MRKINKYYLFCDFIENKFDNDLLVGTLQCNVPTVSLILIIRQSQNIFRFLCIPIILIIVIFQRQEFDFNPVHVHLMSFSDFEPLDYLDQLTSDEKERFFAFTNLQRKREFVATRMLRHELFGFQHIHYDEVGAPYIEDEGFISISHTKNRVGIALCKDFKVGLDLEVIHSKIDNIKHKFLSENEKEQLDCNSSIELTKVWSGKECLYKIAGRKRIDFRTELHLEKRTENEWEGKIINPNEILITDLNIFELDNSIVSINTKPCESRSKKL